MTQSEGRFIGLMQIVPLMALQAGLVDPCILNAAQCFSRAVGDSLSELLLGGMVEGFVECSRLNDEIRKPLLVMASLAVFLQMLVLLRKRSRAVESI
jgi:hypothetical protein